MEETKQVHKEPEQPVADHKVEPLKIKKRPKNLGKNKKKEVKIDLAKIKEEKDAVQESSSKEEVLQSTPQIEEKKETPEVELQIVGSTHNETSTEESKEEEKITVIEEIKESSPTFKQEETISSPPIPTLPENVEKLVDFMKDTGGSVEDYVRLNADYSNIDDTALLKEYYKNTKPHLSEDDVEFLMDEKFNYDEEYDEEKDIRRKKLAIKEEVANAKNHLEELKNSYYREIKNRPGVTQDQQKAMEFFNRHKQEQEIATQRHEVFNDNTKKFFSNEFKGFEFNVGEKNFRYNVKNPTDVAAAQSDIATFIKKFLNEDGSVKDYTGYHKAIYAARNADTIAQHFYEQGKADATRDIVTNSKNIDNTARVAPSDNTELKFGDFTIKSISGADSSKLKIKRK
jgi:hypothetical protein